jgi:hypothetical protein
LSLPFILLKSGPPVEAFGVGHNPDPIPLVGSPSVSSSHNTPPTVIPHRGKVTEDAGKASSNKQR